MYRIPSHRHLRCENTFAIAIESNQSKIRKTNRIKIFGTCGRLFFFCFPFRWTNWSWSYQVRLALWLLAAYFHLVFFFWKFFVYFFGGHQVLMRFEYKYLVVSTRLTIFHNFHIYSKSFVFREYLCICMFGFTRCATVVSSFYFFMVAFYHLHRIIIISRLIKFKFVSLFGGKFVDDLFSVVYV